MTARTDGEKKKERVRLWVLATWKAPLFAKQITGITTFTFKFKLSMCWSALGEPEWEWGEHPLISWVQNISCILHLEILLLPYEKETQLLLSLGTTAKTAKPPKPPRQGMALWWESAITLRVRLKPGWAEGTALVTPATQAAVQCPDMLQIFTVPQSPTSSLLGIWDVDTKQQTWWLGLLKTTEVGLLISVGTRASVGGIHSAINWIISFFQSKFCDAFLHRPQIVRHPAYML